MFPYSCKPPLIIAATYLTGMLAVGFIVAKLNIRGSSDYMPGGRQMVLFVVAVWRVWQKLPLIHWQKRLPLLE